jgi:hypothetical protein
MSFSQVITWFQLAPIWGAKILILTRERPTMNTKKIEMKQDRLSRVQAKVESHKKALAAKGLDEKRIANDPTMRHFLAETRRIRHAIETLQWVPPKEAPAEAKAEKQAAEPKAPKAPKPPKEKKAPKQEQAAPV